MSKLALLSIALAAAACTKQESRLDSVASASSPAAAAAASASAPGGTSAEARLSRVERRLDKVISMLEEAMGPAGPDRNTVYSVPISATDPAEGPADAKVTIVEAFEFLCPACYMANPIVDRILETYAKDVRVVGKYVVIHREPAVWAAQVGCAANKQGKYTPVKAALWNGLFKVEGGQPAVRTENASLDAMKKLAVEAGADPVRLEADLEGCKAWIQDSSRTLNPLGIRGTPSFFVNGRFIQSFDPAEFDAVIKEEIAKADKAIADGVPQAEYYQRQIVAKGAKKAKGRFED